MDSLKEWKEGLDRQTRQLLQGIGLDFLRVGVALGIILTGALFWRIALPAAAAGAGGGRDQQSLDTVTTGSTTHPR